jgi:hypothetical protein
MTKCDSDDRPFDDRLNTFFYLAADDEVDQCTFPSAFLCLVWSLTGRDWDRAIEKEFAKSVANRLPNDARLADAFYNLAIELSGIVNQVIADDDLKLIHDLSPPLVSADGVLYAEDTVEAMSELIKAVIKDDPEQRDAVRHQARVLNRALGH